MEFKDVVYGRRSIRKYQDKPIPDDILQEIVDEALMAPSGTNLQHWYFLIVKSEAKLNKLKELLVAINPKIKTHLEARFENHPEVVKETTTFFDTLGGAKVCALCFLLKPESANMNAVQSAAAAVENFCLSAYDKGLGTCWIVPLFEEFGEWVKAEFAPDKGQFIAAITLGYPAHSPNAPKRKPGRYDYV